MRSMLKHVLKVSEEDLHLRLDVFLTKNLPEISSRSFIQKIIESNGVTVNQRAVKSHYKVNVGDVVELEIPKSLDTTVIPENIPLNIFYEDEDILVINKPVGMMVHPAPGFYSGTLVNALLFHCQSLSDGSEASRPGIVHRLDRETSGLMVVAKNNQGHVRLARQFEKHKVKKQYVALVKGLVQFDEGLIDASLGRNPRHREKKAVVFYESAKEAQTFYRVKQRFCDKTLVWLYPLTGRTHQLRVHMAYLGHPILGDDKYGQMENFPRLALHAQSLAFFHPRTSCYLEFSTKTPSEFMIS